MDGLVAGDGLEQSDLQVFDFEICTVYAPGRVALGFEVYFLLLPRREQIEFA